MNDPLKVHDDLDLARVPVEIRKALEDAGHPVEWVDRVEWQVDPDDAETILLHDAAVTSAPLARLPVYRVRRADYERLRPFVGKTLHDQFPQHEADQLAAAINAGNIAVRDPVDADFVAVEANGVKVCAVHRCHLVDGWPS